MKDVAKKLVLNFLDEPLNSTRRLPNRGIYASYYFGESKRVKLILLDTRYDKDV